MDIKKAKKQIAESVKAYLAKDGYGRYLIPQYKQRPLFLMGPPGIGKTEIMSQVAAELGIGLLSYSMTHHTRQSALGLPIIKHKNYFGKEYDVSEYTMSEIIAAVYDTMTESGLENGILFLDEINCVSETLTPVMLQFLQYKVFGAHKLPEGWIVVTAGNPVEYNNSVREFDIVTWDRLKRIDVEPSFEAWKEYAYTAGVHSAVLTYLEIKPQNFYKIEATVSGKSFVTARGWDDMSRMLTVYEQCGMEADGGLVSQYLQNKQIAEDFAAYYELYKKYKSDYKINDILLGNADENIKKRAASAAFDERYSLLGLLLEAVGNDAKKLLRTESVYTLVMDKLKELKENGGDVKGFLSDSLSEAEKKHNRLKAANSVSAENDDLFAMQSKVLKYYISAAENAGGNDFEAVKDCFNNDISDFKADVAAAKTHFANMFDFCEEVFGSSSRELLILITELAANAVTARYISSFGCPEYHKHDKVLMFHERRTEIINEINKLDLENME
ncbi:MAG: AAA family ATPase [Firmicutes bacterium]|nr:AAA family ATPase [Bacillota bacterium]